LTFVGDPDVDLAAELLGALAQRDAPLGSLTTYRVGGPAALVVQVTRPDDLVRVGVALRESGLPLLVVGRGSNLLVSDRGFRGLVLTLDPTSFGTLDLPEHAGERSGRRW